MSQEEVFRILQELGGEATTSQIRKVAKEKFPDLSLSQYINNRLVKLEDYGFIERRIDECGETSWIIKRDFLKSP